MDRIRHDVAWRVSVDIVEVFSPLLRDEERRDAFEEVYERVKAGLLAYDQETNDHFRRLSPLSTRTGRSESHES
jgi:hypothetical protein